jgi:glutamate carboxypeptidase
MKLISALLALAFLALPAAAEARLAREEQRMAATVDRETERSIQLLERLVNQNSGTLNLPGVTAAAEIVRPEFEQLGFEVRWIDMRETARAGHLVATHQGNGRGRRILLIGHLDTVFEPDSPFQRFERQGERATGPGIGDDKGGIVVVIAALRAMHAAGTLRNADITVLLTGDEERLGSPIATARRDLIEAGRWADVALEFENLAVETAAISEPSPRRSSTSWTLARPAAPAIRAASSRKASATARSTSSPDPRRFRRDLPRRTSPTMSASIGGGTPAAIDAQGLSVTASGKTISSPRPPSPRATFDADPRAGRADPRPDAGDRRAAPAADLGRARLLRTTLSAAAADGRQPRAPRPAQPRQPRPRPPEMPEYDPPAACAPIRASSRPMPTCSRGLGAAAACRGELSCSIRSPARRSASDLMTRCRASGGTEAPSSEEPLAKSKRVSRPPGPRAGSPSSSLLRMMGWSRFESALGPLRSHEIVERLVVERWKPLAGPQPCRCSR